MTNQSLGQFLDEWKGKYPTDVVRLDNDTDIDSLTALAFELERRRHAPILTIDRPTGFDTGFVSNVFGSWERIAGILGVDRPGFVRAWLDAEANRLEPVRVGDAEVHAVTLRGDDVDASALPIPHHFPADGGRYISGGIVATKDPDSGIRNLSFARMQLKGPRKFGISLHSRGHTWDFFRRAEARGDPLEVAVVVGAHPALLMAASHRTSMDFDEYELAGGILGEPVEVIEATTVTIDVPAAAEIVLEGRILPGVREPEGPFGEYPGYSSNRSTGNVFEVDALTRRPHPLFLDVVPGNSSDHLNLTSHSRDAVLFERVREAVPTLKALHLPNSGTTFHCVFSFEKTAEGQARQAMLLLFGLDPKIKLAIACDDDIDVYDTDEVLWAVATRVQADRDVFTVPNVFCNLLDPSARDGMSTRMGIDATRATDWEAKRCVVGDEAAAAARSMADAILSADAERSQRH
jgi:4-hydroxy-3-polyprenylbenzoate decarboxylase